MARRLSVLMYGVGILLIVCLIGCSPAIHGTVQLLDSSLTPVAGESPKGTVVNMINTTVPLEEASFSALVDEAGRFESPKSGLKPGTYKVEANRIGYMTETRTVELGCCSAEEVHLTLKQIQEGKRTSIKSSRSDEDKIINPGEVNIQPPLM
ncbi:MAG: carboxypeptidase-like regulatory domain-containing protein [bacterium]